MGTAVEDVIDEAIPTLMDQDIQKAVETSEGFEGHDIVHPIIKMEGQPVKLEPGKYREDLDLYTDESDLDDDEDTDDIELLKEDLEDDFNELGVGKILKDIAVSFDKASKGLKNLSCKFPNLSCNRQLHTLSRATHPQPLVFKYSENGRGYIHRPCRESECSI